jgi:hypothetical protein
MFKNKSGQGVYVFAYDTLANIAKIGDAANITAKISKDGKVNFSVIDTNPTEIGGGVYRFDISTAETNADSIAITSSSTTPGVQLDVVSITTTEEDKIPKFLLETTTLAGSTSTTLVLASGPLISNVYDGATVLVYEVQSLTWVPRTIKSYTSPGLTVLLDRSLGFDPEPGDLVKIMPAYADPVATVNAVEVSGDSTAADNLELQYDGTGLTGPTFPSTQNDITLIQGAGYDSATDSLKSIRDRGDSAWTGKGGPRII